MTPEERTVMTTLVQQLQDEKDQQKFLQLVKDLNELLERKQHRNRFSRVNGVIGWKTAFVNEGG